MAKRRAGGGVPEQPLWYKDAIIYELHVRAFRDADGDGIGDFRGLIEKLDYLRDLGVTALWLLPFYPSPLRDDGYDIANYNDVHPSYGSLADFKTFLKAAHDRGLRVITELVVNHTSAEHPWFQRARHAPPGSPARDFYVWSDTPDRYGEARIIFQDFETSNWSWDPVAKQYYWHRFYSHQPDLNFDNPRVHKAVIAALDFWFQLGVDGLRLDAIPYLYERDGTNCENLPETHVFLKKLRAHVDANYADRMLLAEANQWPEDAVAYFGSADECHMCFHFPVMPRMYMSLQLEDRFPIIDILEQTPAIPNLCQWAVFLRNHDELTLEMVTDEDRDYMYRIYAADPRARINLGIRRRLMPLVGSRDKVELLTGLLLSMPGTPVLYYGDEIGMGDNIYLGDRNGVRTPMQWSSDRNAGFSAANPQKLFLPVIIDPEYHYEAINVEAQQANPNSLLWWTKRLIDLRRQFKAFGRGTMTFLHPRNRRVLTFVRQFENETLLIVANLSRFAQYVELDLSAWKGMSPVELFGRSTFPRIGDQPYLMTLGPHAFYWFSLEAPRVAEEPTAETRPMLEARRWEELVSGAAKQELERLLVPWLMGRRWFGGKARSPKSARIVDSVRLPWGEGVHLAIIEVAYQAERSDQYVVPLTFAGAARGRDIERDAPQSVVSWVRSGDGEGLLYDALYDPGFANWLLDVMARKRTVSSDGNELSLWAAPELRDLLADSPQPAWPTRVSKAEQSNTSVILGDRLILKLFRRLEDGVNPELELGRFLGEKKFSGVAPLAGSVEYHRGREPSRTVMVLQSYVKNEGDAWQYTIDSLGHYFERVLTLGATDLFLPSLPLADIASVAPPEKTFDIIGSYLASAQLLGRRTAELHMALASGSDLPELKPEPFTSLYQRSLYQSIRSSMIQTLDLLSQRLPQLPEPAQGDARWILEQRNRLHERLRTVLERKISGLRIRIHGDFHLGQVLNTGDDFVIIDFEGEPRRPLSERRIKRSPLRDIAGMLRSFHYAAGYALRNARLRTGDVAELRRWASYWYVWVSAAYLRSYLETAADAAFLPRGPRAFESLLDVYLLDKAAYELAYELDNRPDWVELPVSGLRHLLESAR